MGVFQNSHRPRRRTIITKTILSTEKLFRRLSATFLAPSLLGKKENWAMNVNAFSQRESAFIIYNKRDKTSRKKPHIWYSLLTCFKNEEVKWAIDSSDKGAGKLKILWPKSTFRSQTKMSPHWVQTEIKSLPRLFSYELFWIKSKNENITRRCRKMKGYHTSWNAWTIRLFFSFPKQN